MNIDIDRIYGEMFDDQGVFKKVSNNKEILNDDHIYYFAKDFSQNEIFPLQTQAMSKHFFHAALSNLLRAYPDYNVDDLYRLNSFGLRSDEFFKKHNKKHLLFAGCSNTFGEGNLLEHTWAHKVYKKISSQESVSGYFNIGVSGMAISGIISQIFSYFKMFGHPDALFINFPDFEREFSKFTNPAMGSRQIDNDTINRQIFSRSIVTQYFMLLDICKLNNTKVYNMTWETKMQLDFYSPPDPRTEFVDLYVADDQELADYCLEFKQKNAGHPLERYFVRGLDKMHQGIAIHDFWYNKMYQMYMKDR